MQKGIILFDIDNTIVNSHRMEIMLYEEVYKILKNVSRKDPETITKYDDSLLNPRYFVPEDYVQKICDDFNFNDEEKLLEVFYGGKYKRIYKDSLFPETRVVLEKLKGEFRLGIFSEGTHKYQTNKSQKRLLTWNLFERHKLFNFVDSSSLLFILRVNINIWILPHRKLLF